LYDANYEEVVLKMKLIVADDSRLIRGIIDKAATSIGFEVIHAVNGKEALDLLAANGQDINLVLLDWNMPILNGIDALRDMRGNDRFKDIPVLMISTESEDDKIKEAVDAGAHGYLAKPFTANMLTHAIQQVLGQKA
jgi:two-component system, chemotaxis family, chemotaxis protein CheY